MKMVSYNQGRFRPKNPKKYKGKVTDIFYRSSYEMKLMIYLDSHPDVISWSSEELIIRYRSPLDGRVHRYFPDFVVEKKDINGIIEKLVIEVKPAHQTTAPKPPVNNKKKMKTYLKECATYAINSAKWNAAEAWCKNNGYKFVKFTEKELGIL